MERVLADAPAGGTVQTPVYFIGQRHRQRGNPLAILILWNGTRWGEDLVSAKPYPDTASNGDVDRKERSVNAPRVPICEREPTAVARPARMWGAHPEVVTFPIPSPRERCLMPSPVGTGQRPSTSLARPVQYGQAIGGNVLWPQQRPLCSCGRPADIAESPRGRSS